jgi:hypothetical protein
MAVARRCYPAFVPFSKRMGRQTGMADALGRPYAHPTDSSHCVSLRWLLGATYLSAEGQESLLGLSTVKSTVPENGTRVLFSLPPL